MRPEVGGSVARRLDRLFGLGTVSGLGEGALLDRFVTRKDPAAFEAIVARHGPMVWGICRRTLRDPNDAEDAFQAVFLILARRAAAIRQGDRLGGWLHGVAYRVTTRARRDAMRRSAHAPIEGHHPPAVVESDEAEIREQMALLHEEIRRLPSRYRDPIVLCHLEGCSHVEAAARLGWPVGTVRGRLARGRDQLRDRLTRRGMGVAMLAPLQAIPAQPALPVPAGLAQTTVTAAIGFATGQDLAGLISAQVLLWVKGGLRAMWLHTFKLSVAGLAAVGILTVGAGAGAGALGLGQREGQTESESPATPVTNVAAVPPTKPAEPAKEAETTDVFTQIAELQTELQVLQTEIEDAANQYMNLWRLLNSTKSRLASQPLSQAQKEIDENNVQRLPAPVEEARISLVRKQAKRARLEKQIRDLERAADEPSNPKTRAGGKSTGEPSLDDEIQIAEAEAKADLLRSQVEFEKEQIESRRRLLWQAQDQASKPHGIGGGGADPVQNKAFEVYLLEQVTMIRSQIVDLEGQYLRNRTDLARQEHTLRLMKRKAGTASPSGDVTTNIEKRLRRIESAIESLREALPAK